MSPTRIHEMERQKAEEDFAIELFTEHEDSGASSKPSVLQHVFERGRAALKMLYEATLYAKDVKHSLWDFSVEIALLREGGLAHSDLRWLLCKGLLEQAGEIPCGDSKSRRFLPNGTLSFSRTSCFILTEAGQAFVRKSLGRVDSSREDSGLRFASVPQESSSYRTKPCWDRDRQELRVGIQVVKQFKVPAPNQEIILAAFHEEGWPVRIDDPLPPRLDLEPKRRLHDTIKALNRNQESELMRFLGDGSGRGVRWEFGFEHECHSRTKSSLNSE